MDLVDKNIPLMTPTFFEDDDPNNPKRIKYVEAKRLSEDIRRHFDKYWQIPCDGEDRCVQRVICQVRDIIANYPESDVHILKHGKWIEEHGACLSERYDESGELIIHNSTLYKCNLCGRVESQPEPYCNCGAKMEGITNV